MPDLGHGGIGRDAIGVQFTQCGLDLWGGERLYTLADYVADGIMPNASAGLLSKAVAERCNILIAGGTSSGKTTLANALLA